MTVHNINPVLLEFWGIKFWYYGLAYALGFLGIHLWVMWKRTELDVPAEEVWNLSILFSASALIGGRVFEIVVYEWDYYMAQPSEIPKYWHGGMASHGVILGATIGVLLFCVLHKRSFLKIADAIVVPVAFFLGVGRIGNHINGEIYGYVTDVWWAVKFPYAEGLRHPVALYDGAKNFFIIPILLLVRRNACVGQGKLLAHFIFWYGFLRLFVDYFREYGSEFLGVGRGQYYNLLMAAVGLSMMAWFGRTGRQARKNEDDFVGTRQPLRSASVGCASSSINVPTWLKAAVFVLLLFLSLTISSGWSQMWLRDLAGR